MVGDSFNSDGFPVKLNILAGVPYVIWFCTLTFARRPDIGDPITPELFIEIDGKKPCTGDAIDPNIAVNFLYNVFELG